MKTKALISCAVTAQLICGFVFAYAKSRFSHDAAQMSPNVRDRMILFYYDRNICIFCYSFVICFTCYSLCEKLFKRMNKYTFIKFFHHFIYLYKTVYSTAARGVIILHISLLDLIGKNMQRSETEAIKTHIQPPKKQNGKLIIFQIVKCKEYIKYND